MDKPKDGPTDQRTEKASYRVASPRLKKGGKKKKRLLAANEEQMKQNDREKKQGMIRSI